MDIQFINFLEKKLNLNIRGKMLLLILTTTFIIYVTTIGYISINLRNKSLADAKELVNSKAKESANYIRARLDTDFGLSRTLASTFLSHNLIEDSLEMAIFENILINTMQTVPHCVSTWASFELSAFDPNWTKPYGRTRINVVKENGKIKIINDSLDLTSHNLGSTYYKIKTAKKETIDEPYYDTYGENSTPFLMTSICVPILENSKFIGLAGVDILLDRFEGILSGIQPFEGSYAFLLSNKARYVYHPQKDIVGQFMSEVNPEEDLTYNFTERISAGESFSEMAEGESGSTVYVTFASFTAGHTETPWSLGIIAPTNVILAKANAIFLRTIIIGIIGLIILGLIIWFISHNIATPILETTKILEDLTKGEIDESKKLTIKSKDEIGRINTSVNALIDGLNATANYAKEIGEGNLETEIKLLSEKDVLGISILEMRENLKKAKEEEEERKTEEEKNKWITHGLAKFGEILRMNNNNMEEFSFNIISNLTNYINANQGGLFIINNEDENNIFIQLAACYAYDRRKFLEKKIDIGEGLIGQCVLEAETIHLTEVPQNYISITSGLGSETPGNLIIVPLKVNEEVFGVVELASFDVFESHIIEFTEKIAESVASSISNVKINVHTSKLLEASKSQSEELAAQEEEMRQNLEELQATQEEANRREKEILGIVNAMNTSLIVSEYDSEGNIIEVNERFCKVFNKTRNEFIGKNRYEVRKFSNTENNEFWYNVKAGKVVKIIVNEKVGDNEIWLSETYSPIFNNDGNLYKILCIAVNISESKEQEKKIKELFEESKQRNEQLHSREKALAHESSLLNALMNSVPDYIYFKDHESKFIRISKSHASLFGFNDPKKLIGKSDFDFFDKDHAQPAYNDEQNIIKTGNPIIDLVEKETWEDGSISWVTTTKMPLKDQDGKTIGTFGISKSITDLKQKEIEVEQQNKIFDLITSNTPIIVYKINREGKFIEFKGAGLSSMAIKEKDIIGTEAFKLYPELKKITKKAFKTEKHHSFISKQKDYTLNHFVIENSIIEGSLIGFAYKV